MSSHSSKTSLISHEPEETLLRAFVFHPLLPPSLTEKREGEHNSLLFSRSDAQKLEEALNLSKSLSIKVVGGEFIRVSKIRPSTLIGKGALDSWGAFLKEQSIRLVVMDTMLSPIQQRNLERTWKVKVLDRTGLILEIFASRAQTREGSLQVELASLKYQRSRLVKTWTHLERQRGGFGFLAGPGETQLEMDKRILETRIKKIERDLEKVKKTRALHRKARTQVPFPVVALVGYTNAGKSTLFNRLTKADVYVKDQLFATLDPTLRRIRLPSGRSIILSDTVGFISDLPHELIAAFRATLEEVQEATLIIHVRDTSSPESFAQAQDVEKVLEELQVAESFHKTGIEAFNKIDLEPHVPIKSLYAPYAVGVSALTGEGCERLIKKVEDILGQEDTLYSIVLSSSQGKELAWLYAHGEVLKRQDKKEKISLQARLSKKSWNEFQKLLKEE